MSLKKRSYLGWERRTPTAARSFADLSFASGPLELAPEEAYVRLETRVERQERSATRCSRRVRRALAEMKAEGLVSTEGSMAGRMTGGGGGRVETGV